MLSIGDVSREDFLKIFASAEKMESDLKDPRKRAELRHILHKPGCDPLWPQICEQMEFQCLIDDSTRTDFTTTKAIEYLGGKIVSKSVHASSVSKGESARMTGLVFAPHIDGLIVRNDKESFFAQEMAEAIDKRGFQTSVFNAGCGDLEHPTQTPIDFYPFYKKRKREFLEGNFVFGIVGDLSRSRTIHSFLKGLANFYSNLGSRVVDQTKVNKVKIYLLAPEREDLPGWLNQDLANSNLNIERAKNFLDVAPCVDGWYFTRWQGNLRKDATKEQLHAEESAYAEQYGATKENRKSMNKLAIAGHPLPHGREYPLDLDLVDDRFVHIKQMHWAVYIRMAIFYLRYTEPGATVKVERECSHSNGPPMDMVNVQIPINEVISKCATKDCANAIITGYGRAVEILSNEFEKLKNVPNNTFCPSCSRKIYTATHNRG